MATAPERSKGSAVTSLVAFVGTSPFCGNITICPAPGLLSPSTATMAVALPDQDVASATLKIDQLANNPVVGAPRPAAWMPSTVPSACSAAGTAAPWLQVAGGTPLACLVAVYTAVPGTTSARVMIST